MNDSSQTIELLSTRRSVPTRLLKDPAPSAEQLETLLTIAAHVPDHARVVPWRFIVIDRVAGERFADVIERVYRSNNPEPAPDAERIATERGRLTRAPLTIAVVAATREHPKAPEWEQILSAGAACMSILAAATAMGFGANWHTEWIAYDRQILDALGLAASERIAGFIYIGTPTERPAERPRPALADIVTTLKA